jgi:hypothetical protein
VGEAEVSQLESAIALTESLAAEYPESTPNTEIWQSTQAAESLDLLRDAGYDPDEFLEDAPPDMAMAPGLFLRRYFESYKRQIRGALCNENEELRKNINTAIGAGTGTLLTALAALLAVPLAAVALLAPIAAIILIKGIDAFCTMDDV